MRNGVSRRGQGFAASGAQSGARRIGLTGSDLSEGVNVTAFVRPWYIFVLGPSHTVVQDAPLERRGFHGSSGVYPIL